MTRAEADHKMNALLDRMIEMLDDPSLELSAAIEKMNQKSPDWERLFTRATQSLRRKS